MSSDFTSNLMNVKECSEFLKLSISTLRKHCCYKRIPFLKMGGKVMFYKPDIQKWALSNR
jgi:excisionase family DNA binding protein